MHLLKIIIALWLIVDLLIVLAALIATVRDARRSNSRGFLECLTCGLFCVPLVAAVWCLCR